MAYSYSLLLLQALLLVSAANARDVARILSSPQTTLASRLTRLAAKRNIIITQASCGYLQFADNWVAHIQLVGLHNFLIIAEDQTAQFYLEDRYPGHVVSAALLTNQPLSQRSEFFEYATAGFSRLTCMRPTYLRAVLQQGFSVLWLDLDAAVLVNPFRLLPQVMDYVGVDDSERLDSEQDSEQLCTCFLFLRPTLRVHQLLQMWVRRCENSSSNDQVEWNRVFSAGERKVTDYYIMPQRVFPDGSVADRRTANVKDVEPGTRSLGQPGWLHANFRVGHGLKREFFLHRKAWRAQHPDTYPSCTP